MKPAFVAWVAVAGLCIGSTTARAFEVVVDYEDPPGVGFYDESFRTPVGGNQGETLGEQRRIAFEFAIAIWAEALDSPVPVVISATFSPAPPLPCSPNSAVLGAASPASAVRGFPGAPDPELAYPLPLANRLAGRDLAEELPDVEAVFNPELDAQGCLDGVRWDYSLEPEHHDAAFVGTVLHEFAHGLGFASVVDVVTGESPGVLTPFEQHVFDNESGLSWAELSAQQRRQSARRPFGLAWGGPWVRAAAPLILAPGRPFVQVEENTRVDLVGEALVGERVTQPISGVLRRLEARDACRGSSSLEGEVVLLSSEQACPDILQQLQRSESRGALAALIRNESSALPPHASELPQVALQLPSLTLAQSEFDAMEELEGRGVVLGSRDGWVGADDEGRPLLSANDPIQEGSSVSHWDRSVRRHQASPGEPNTLLMEPVGNGILDHSVQELSVQLLQDMGWGEGGCGNGHVEPGEQCDDGSDNSDVLPGACRLDCQPARCGDGVLDPAEDCDPGAAGDESCRVCQSDAGATQLLSEEAGCACGVLGAGGSGSRNWRWAAVALLLGVILGSRSLFRARGRG